MTLKNPVPLQPFSFWSSRTRRRLTLVSIVATIIGIYLNVSINYAHLISDRARMSADAIQNLNLAYGSPVAVNGKPCLRFVNSELQRIPNDRVRSSVLVMWDDEKPDERPFEGVTKDERELVIECFAGVELSVPAGISTIVPGVTKDMPGTLAMARQYMRREIFGYLNVHETIFDLVRGEKIDSRVICSQLEGDIKDGHPIVIFVQNIRRQLGDDELRSAYPGLAWYSKNLEFCKNSVSLWFENAIKPLLPWKSERS